MPIAETISGLATAKSAASPPTSSGIAALEASVTAVMAVMHARFGCVPVVSVLLMGFDVAYWYGLGVGAPGAGCSLGLSSPGSGWVKRARPAS